MLPLFPNKTRGSNRHLNLELEEERWVEEPVAPAGEAPAPVARIIGGLGRVGMGWDLVIEPRDSMESAAITLLRARPRRPELDRSELEQQPEPGAGSAGAYRSGGAVYYQLEWRQEGSHCSSSAYPSTCGVACNHCHRHSR